MAWILGIFGVICGLLYAFVFETWTIPGDDAQLAASIEPTISVGDAVLVFRSTSLDVGVLARCPDPDAPGRFVVGRVIGQANDTLDISGGTFLYNGTSVSSPVACDTFHYRHPVSGEDIELHCSYEEFAGITHPAVRTANDPPKHVKV
jgi:signal peptidase I